MHLCAAGATARRSAGSDGAPSRRPSSLQGRGRGRKAASAKTGKNSGKPGGIERRCFSRGRGFSRSAGAGEKARGCPERVQRRGAAAQARPRMPRVRGHHHTRGGAVRPLCARVPARAVSLLVCGGEVSGDGKRRADVCRVRSPQPPRFRDATGQGRVAPFVRAAWLRQVDACPRIRHAPFSAREAGVGGRARPGVLAGARLRAHPFCRRGSSPKRGVTGRH